MPKCGCAGSSCSCLIEGGAGVTIEGVGSADRPYLISSAPVSESLTLELEQSTYMVGSGEPLGSLNAIQVEFDGDTTAGFIILPDGSNAVPLPPPGAQIDLFVVGSETATYSFGGGAILTWATTPPVGDQQGWYHFVYLPTTSPRYLATFVG